MSLKNRNSIIEEDIRPRCKCGQIATHIRWGGSSPVNIKDGEKRNWRGGQYLCIKCVLCIYDTWREIGDGRSKWLSISCYLE